MISVVCVFNNEEILDAVLLTSLKRQVSKFELILLDNRDARYKSAAQALNDGGRRAAGDFIMFAHQDMWFESPTWLEDAEKTMSSIADLGIAGVAGQAETGRNWRERCRWSIFSTLLPPEGIVQRPEPVQTLDECLLIVPKRVFTQLKFDEETFDGWHCYGADYCLSVTDMGLQAYVIPGPCAHSCLRANNKDLIRYQRRLYHKHARRHKRIYTWTGEISRSHLAISPLRSAAARIYSRTCADVPGTLSKHLSDCHSILDLGCGNHSILVYAGVLPSEHMTVGVEMFEPALQESRRKFIHAHYVLGDVRRIEFKPNSFDAVVALDVLEHLTKEEGLDLLTRMQVWARKKVMVFTPNGYVWQDDLDHNPLQVHRCGWSPRELRGLGFQVLGLNGLKWLRGYKSATRFRPALFWEIVSGLTQRFTYRMPVLAFQLLAVKQPGRRVDEMPQRKSIPDQR